MVRTPAIREALALARMTGPGLRPAALVPQLTEPKPLLFTLPALCHVTFERGIEFGLCHRYTPDSMTRARNWSTKARVAHGEPEDSRARAKEGPAALNESIV